MCLGIGVWSIIGGGMKEKLDNGSVSRILSDNIKVT